jgi:outer membrane protein OmpA-like peptidoglycan-associated protein
MLARLLAIPLLLLAAGLARAGEPDAEGCQDPPGFTRVRGFRISRCERAEFEAVPMLGAKGAKLSAEGARVSVFYELAEGEPQRSTVQLVRNYEAAFKTLGGGAVWKVDDGAETYLHAKTRDGREIWGFLSAYNPSFPAFTLVQKAAMVQDVTATAAALGAGLAETGHVEVPGILFDTGLATLKPESDAALAECARLLAAQPGLKVYVVGHTDNVGALAANLALSAARADAVVKALSARFKVAPARLAPFGAGPYLPVASNGSEAGRARNRRVELVAQ